MLRSLSLVAALCMLTLPAPAKAWFQGLELEAARARARAGYAITPRDAELLERFGCSNGIEDDFCYWLKYKEQHRRYYLKRRHRSHGDRYHD